MSFSQRMALRLLRYKLRLQNSLAPKSAAAAAFRIFTTPQYRNTKELTGIFESAEVIRFPFQEFEIQGYRWGTGAGRTALILHGFESSVVNFGLYVQPLLDRGFCVMGFDAPAHGRSSGQQVNVRIYMQFIEAIRERFGPIDRYLAHSLGGLSLCLALEEQGNYQGCRLALIAPATETRTAIDYYFRFLKLPGSMRPVFDELIEQRGGHPVSWFSVARSLPQLQIPVLWVHDQDDDLTPLSDVEPVRKKTVPGLQFYITKGLGHRRIYRDPNVVQRVVQFLSE